MLAKSTDKKETLSYWKHEADKWFSLYIRLKEADEAGIVTCFICGSRHWYKDTDCAHFMDRDNMSLRYNEMNCHACCTDCNRFDPNHADYYWHTMVSKYGQKEVEELMNQKHNLMKFTRYELQQLAKEFKEKFETLKRNKKI